jgi:hypothetical protein
MAVPAVDKRKEAETLTEYTNTNGHHCIRKTSAQQRTMLTITG